MEGDSDMGLLWVDCEAGVLCRGWRKEAEWGWKDREGSCLFVGLDVELGLSAR